MILDKTMTGTLLDNAVAAGDALVSQATRSGSGACWYSDKKTRDLDKILAQESIIDGNAGIILFLMELYKATGSDRYLEMVARGLQHLEQRIKSWPLRAYGLYRGKMGLHYCVQQAAPFLGRENIPLDNEMLRAFSHSYFVDDSLCEGRAGALLGVLSLSQVWHGDDVQNAVQHLSANMLERTVTNENGIFWNRSVNSIKGLVGFGHGGSGVGFVFLEMSRLFNDDFLHAVADQSFSYEDFYWSEAHANWPDFRKGIADETSFERFRDAYRQNEYDFFLPSYDNTSWEHGSVGIGLSRLRAFQLTGDRRYEKYIDHVFSTISSGQVCSPFELFARNTFLINACNVFGKSDYRQTGQLLMRDWMKYHDMILEQSGNFIDKAYLGLACLQASGISMTSVLYPVASEVMPGAIDRPSSFPGRERLITSYLKSGFPETLGVIEAEAPTQLNDFLKQETPIGIGTFVRFMNEAISQDPEATELAITFHAEYKAWLQSGGIDNYPLLFQEELALADKNEEILRVDDDTLLEMELCLNGDLVMEPSLAKRKSILSFESCRPGDLIDCLQSNLAEVTYIFRSSSLRGSMIITLSKVHVLVLNQFLDSNNISNALLTLERILRNCSTEEQEQLCKLFGVSSFTFFYAYVCDDLKTFLKDAVGLGILSLVEAIYPGRQVVFTDTAAGHINDETRLDQHST